MTQLIKKRIYLIAFSLLLFMGLILPLGNCSHASWRDSVWDALTDGGFGGDLPQYERDFADQLTDGGWVLDNKEVDKRWTLRQNVIALFYPSELGDKNNALYRVIRNITLGVMIIFIVWTGGSLLLNRKPEETKKSLGSLLYILLGGVFVYAANRLFGEVLHFSNDQFTIGQTGVGGFTDAFIGKNSVLFVILSAIKAFAFFLAIIMIVVTGFKVVAAGEGEKGKKLVKGLINVVVALLIIKGVDFIYYLAADSSTFVKNASDFIINVAKVFGYIYGVVIVIMVILAGYLYITDGGSGSNFKKASNILINILLSALVLFTFLLIAYQIFAEFQSGGDALIQASEQVAESSV